MLEAIISYLTEDNDFKIARVPLPLTVDHVLNYYTGTTIDPSRVISINAREVDNDQHEPNQYLVKWEVDIFDCESHEEAATRALMMVSDEDSIAHVFDVKETGSNVWKRVDLDELKEQQEINNEVA